MIGKKIRYKAMIGVIKIVKPSLYKQIRGFLHNLESKEFLQQTPRPSTLFIKRYFNGKELVGAEIGVNIGKNAKSLLSELNIKKLFLVDIWENEEMYQLVCNNFNNEKIEIIKNDSLISANLFNDRTLDFVYIDADHSYNGVFNDIESWFKKVKNKGIIAGHDILSPVSVYDAVKDWCNINQTQFYINIPDWYIFKNEV